MTIADSATDTMRCSAWARAARLDPIGSAGSYRGFLLIEMPLPWPRDVNEMPPIAALADLLASAGLRVQAVVPEGSHRRVITYLNPATEGFAGFTRREVDYDSDLRGTVAAAVAAFDGDAADDRRDLLVCTHGRRDVCCGTLGMGLFANLANISIPGDVQRWRTSHTGGHRFAPTFIVLPEGTAWAHADADLVDRVLYRRGDAAAVVDHYRGCAGLASQTVQALEREVLRRVGWPLLEARRTGETGPDGRTRLVVEQAGGQSEVWEGWVEPGRQMPVPDCGRPIEEARKSETEWVVRDARLL